MKTFCCDKLFVQEVISGFLAKNPKWLLTLLVPEALSKDETPWESIFLNKSLLVCTKDGIKHDLTFDLKKSSFKISLGAIVSAIASYVGGTVLLKNAGSFYPPVIPKERKEVSPIKTITIGEDLWLNIDDLSEDDCDKIFQIAIWGKVK